MEVIYIVESYVDYETSRPVRAFAEKSAAESFVNLCNSYRRTRPAYATYSDDKNGGSTAWNLALEAWGAAHPAGKLGASADDFDLEEIPFIAKESS